MTVGANHPGSMQTLLLKSAISEYRTFAMHSFASLREIRMPHLTTDDGVKLYYEEVGAGAPIVGCTTLGHKAPHHQPAVSCTARFALRDNHIGPGGTDWPREVKTTPGKFT